MKLVLASAAMVLGLAADADAATPDFLAALAAQCPADLVASDAAGPAPGAHRLTALSGSKFVFSHTIEGQSRTDSLAIRPGGGANDAAADYSVGGKAGIGFQCLGRLASPDLLKFNCWTEAAFASRGSNPAALVLTLSTGAQGPGVTVKAGRSEVRYAGEPGAAPASAGGGSK
ncbi:hypothetical protein BH11PSE2_BH11PSE2_18120 [soil metagenome]